MESKETFFGGWSPRKKLGFGAGLLAIVALVVVLAWWVQRAPKGVLFSDLAERDAAVITAELDKLKLPYSLSEDGKAILVAADAVHRTRMAVMGKQLPLHGVVGFELFNTADFGVSDFVQKVNFQRALQGELTRTILAIEGVQDARVHLALPDQTLFRKDQNRSKASVSVSLKPGLRLSDEQVRGIQRLVASSVPEVKQEDVAVLDQHGVVLSRAGGDEAVVSAGQLDARQSLEAHLTRKAGKLLDQMFQPGESLVAVDVVLNHEQSRVTTEELLGATANDRGSAPVGMVSRERTVTKDSGADTGASNQAQVVTQEFDYQHGKRVAQTVSQGGQIARLTVAVVVKRPLGDVELTRVRQLVASAVGMQPDRGDVVTVHTLAELGAQQTTDAAAPTPNAADPLTKPADVRAAATASADSATAKVSAVPQVIGGVLLAIALVALLVWVMRARQLRVPSAGPALSTAEREALLANVKRWLEPQA